MSFNHFTQVTVCVMTSGIRQSSSLSDEVESQSKPITNKLDFRPKAKCVFQTFSHYFTDSGALHDLDLTLGPRNRMAQPNINLFSKTSKSDETSRPTSTIKSAVETPEPDHPLVMKASLGMENSGREGADEKGKSAQWLSLTSPGARGFSSAHSPDDQRNWAQLFSLKPAQLLDDSPPMPGSHWDKQLPQSSSIVPQKISFYAQSIGDSSALTDSSGYHGSTYPTQFGAQTTRDGKKIVAEPNQSPLGESFLGLGSQGRTPENFMLIDGATHLFTWPPSLVTVPSFDGQPLRGARATASERQTRYRETLDKTETRGKRKKNPVEMCETVETQRMVKKAKRNQRSIAEISKIYGEGAVISFENRVVDCLNAALISTSKESGVLKPIRWLKVFLKKYDPLSGHYKLFGTSQSQRKVVQLQAFRMWSKETCGDSRAFVEAFVLASTHFFTATPPKVTDVLNRLASGVLLLVRLTSYPFHNFENMRNLSDLHRIVHDEQQEIWKFLKEIFSSAPLTAPRKPSAELDKEDFGLLVHQQLRKIFNSVQTKHLTQAIGALSWKVFDQWLRQKRSITVFSNEPSAFTIYKSFYNSLLVILTFKNIGNEFDGKRLTDLQFSFFENISEKLSKVPEISFTT